MLFLLNRYGAIATTLTLVFREGVGVCTLHQNVAMASGKMQPLWILLGFVWQYHWREWVWWISLGFQHSLLPYLLEGQITTCHLTSYQWSHCGWSHSAVCRSSSIMDLGPFIVLNTSEFRPFASPPIYLGWILMVSFLISIWWSFKTWCQLQFQSTFVVYWMS